MSAVVSLPTLAPPLPLADRQRQYYEFICTFDRKHGRSPTRKEIAGAMGVSLAAVQGTLLALQRKGYLRVAVGTVHGIEILAIPGRSPIVDDDTPNRAQVIRLRALLHRAYNTIARLTAAANDARSTQDAIVAELGGEEDP